MSVAPESDRALAAYVRRFGAIPDNHLHGNLKAREVAIIGATGAGLVEALLDAGVARVQVLGVPALSINDPRVFDVAAEPPWSKALPPVDLAFFDARHAEGFDHVSGVARLVDWMRQSLRPDGLLFCVLKTGAVNHGFDVYNPIVRARSGFLPSQEHLLRELLADCAVRMLDWIPTSEPYETLRLFRLSVKRPTLLLILGRSQSGKTSLARDFQALDSQMHVANDYVYCEIVERIRRGAAEGIPAALVEHVGDGSGHACGVFNRKLEADPALLEAYASWLVHLVPRTKRLVSMDFDLVEDAPVQRLKATFEAAGFSVWTVQR